jgi:spore coat polysaccharide biosynthesis protein SpsF
VITGVIQVRMGSTRLPGKALKEVMGRPLLDLLHERVCAAASLEQVVIATGSGPENQPIVDFARSRGIGCYAGSEQDLVERFFQTAQKFGANVIVRVTGDCPLADPGAIDQATRFYLENRDRYDYVSNAIKPTFPDGLDIDVFPLATIERIRNGVQDPFWREWFTSYLRERPQEFRIANVEHTKDLSGLRWTVDYEEDFVFAERIFKSLYPNKKIFTMSDMLELLQAEPEIGRINQKYARDAAYYTAKSEAGK